MFLIMRREYRCIWNGMPTNQRVKPNIGLNKALHVGEMENEKCYDFDGTMKT